MDACFFYSFCPSGYHCFLAAACFAQSSGALDETDILYQQVNRLYKAGKYKEAIPVAERYVAAAKKRFGKQHTRYATAIAWLGVLYQSQGRYLEAEPLYKRDLAIGEKALGPDHPSVGTSLNNLAELYQGAGALQRGGTASTGAASGDQGKGAGPRSAPMWASVSTISPSSTRNQGRYQRGGTASIGAASGDQGERRWDRTIPRVAYQPQQSRRALSGRWGVISEAEPLLYRRSPGKIRRKGAGPRPPPCGHQSQQSRRALSGCRGAISEAEPLLSAQPLAIKRKGAGPRPSPMWVPASTISPGSIKERRGAISVAEPLVPAQPWQNQAKRRWGPTIPHVGDQPQQSRRAL